MVGVAVAGYGAEEFLRMRDEGQRVALAEFLRTRRARLFPADVGLPGNQRRRTPGLRREEVALLANIGISWYVALEQGRDIHPSQQVLESLARALRLSATEQRHLFDLAGQTIPTSWPLSDGEAHLSPVLHQAVQAFDPQPAFVLGRRWDVLARNRAAAAVLTYGKGETDGDRPENLLWTHFTDPLAKKVYPDWETSAESMISLLRTESARFPDDPWFGEMAGRLQAASPWFRQRWARYDIDKRGTMDGRKVMQHPDLGHLEFEYVTLLLPAHPDLKLILYLPDSSTRDKLSQFLTVSLASRSIDQRPQRLSPA